MYPLRISLGLYFYLAYLGRHWPKIGTLREYFLSQCLTRIWVNLRAILSSNESSLRISLGLLGVVPWSSFKPRLDGEGMKDWFSLLDQNNVIGLGLQYQNLPLLHNTIRIGKFHNQIEMLNKMRFFFKTKYKKNTLLWSLLWNLPVIHLFDY